MCLLLDGLMGRFLIAFSLTFTDAKLVVKSESNSYNKLLGLTKIVLVIFPTAQGRATCHSGLFSFALLHHHIF